VERVMRSDVSVGGSTRFFARIGMFRRAI
jgi:hypothetical protein